MVLNATSSEFQVVGRLFHNIYLCLSCGFPSAPSLAIDAFSLPTLVAKSWNEHSKGEVDIHVTSSVQRARDALILRLTWQGRAF